MHSMIILDHESMKIETQALKRRHSMRDLCAFSGGYLFQYSAVRLFVDGGEVREVENREQASSSNVCISDG